MNNLDKSIFISESIKKVIDKQTARISKANKRRVKEICDNGNSEEIEAIMTEALLGVAEVVAEWELKSYRELDGLTPVQYFESLHTVEDMIVLVSLLEEISTGALPMGLATRIKRLSEALSEEIQYALESIQLAENKCFTYKQKAIVRIAEIIALPKFLNGLVGIMKQLDQEQSDENTIIGTIIAAAELGEAAIGQLADLIESNKREGNIYSHAIFAIGRIGSENKSEQIYKLLKDYFRNSNIKLLESRALAVYGDGRAIPAIRGHVERHLEDLTPWEYSEFRSDVLNLGGDMSDLDEYFDDYEEDDDFDDFADAVENE